MVLDRRIWQVATGDDARPLAQSFLAQNVMLLGPGKDGPWSPDNPAYAQRRDIRSFAASAVAGDFVVARRGVRHALALGLLGGEYNWNEAFGDLEGWDLQHYWRVRWIWTGDKRFGRQVFPRSRFSETHNDEVARWATRIARNIAAKDKRLLVPPHESELVPLPEEEKSLSLSRLGKPLRRVIEQAQAWETDTWGGNLGVVPTEDELLTHITVPLLQALGWEPEQIAVKWEYTDLALFDPKRRDPAHCRLVVEGKRIGDGLRWAADQARRYAKKLDLKDADVLTTNGLNYRLYKNPQYSDSEALWANLARPKESALQLFDALRR